MNQSENQVSETKQIGFFKKTRAVMCHHCPFCSYARKNPDSFIGKMLHHPAHAENCPFWLAEKEVYQSQN